MVLSNRPILNLRMALRSSETSQSITSPFLLSILSIYLTESVFFLLTLYLCRSDFSHVVYMNIFPVKSSHSKLYLCEAQALDGTTHNADVHIYPRSKSTIPYALQLLRNLAAEPLKLTAHPSRCESSSIYKISGWRQRQSDVY